MTGPRAGVRTGLDVLLGDPAMFLRGKRYGLICHQASVDRTLRHAIGRLLETGEGTLSALFGPEHGITGEAQDMIGVPGAPRGVAGPPLFSLYGTSEDTLSPTPESLAGLDLLVCDLQDVGSRYYTFAATMGFAMQAAGRAGLPFLVLDRPNPIGGDRVEGNIVEDGWRSFVGAFALPVRHGLTMGELARLYVDGFGLRCDLTVIPMQGWDRRMSHEQTSLPWVAPSPNMPTPDTAMVYPGACLIEGTNLSEGRGTTRPFEWIGAPWLEPDSFAARLTAFGLPDVAWRPMRFTPSFHKHAGQSCGGVQIHVLDREGYRPYAAGLAMIIAARELDPARFDWRREPYEFVSDRLAIDLLLGTDRIRRMIESGDSLESIESSWRVELDRFAPLRQRALLYQAS